MIQFLNFLLYVLLPASLVIGFLLGILAGCIDQRNGFLNRWWRFGIYLIFFGALYWLLDVGLYLDEIKAKEQMAQICDPKNASTKVMPKEAYGKTVKIEEVVSQMDTAIPIEHTQYNYVDITTEQLYFINDGYISSPGWFGRLLAKHQMYDGSGPMSFKQRTCMTNTLIKFDPEALKEKYNIILIWK